MTQRTIKEFIYLMKELDKLEDEIEKDNLIISFLTNKSVNEIEDMSVEEYIKLKNTLPPLINKKNFSDTIVKNDKIYKFTIDPKKISVIQYNDIVTIQKSYDVWDRIIPTLCLLLIEDDVKYDGAEKLKKLEEIGELNYLDCYNLSIFFLTILNELKTISDTYLKQLKQAKQQVLTA